MVLRPKNYAKSANENRPPTARSRFGRDTKGLVSRLGLSDPGHRRRARMSGMTRTAKYAVDHAKRRDDKVRKNPVKFNVSTAPTISDVDMADGSSSSTSRSKTFPLSLPKELTRPAYKPINSELVQAVDPSLADTDLDYLRDSVDIIGPELMQSLTTVRIKSTKDKLPQELTVVVNDLTTFVPSHILAVFGPQPPDTPASVPRKITLFPVHSLVMAANCANLSKVPATLPVPVHQKGDQEMKLPVWTLCLPSPETYPPLSMYLYTKQTDRLMINMLPSPPPPEFLESEEMMLSYATHLSQTFTVQALVKHIHAVYGLWKNVSVLGIFDTQLWRVIDLMWASLLTALAIATGEPYLMIPPQEPREEDSVPAAAGSSSS